MKEPALDKCSEERALDASCETGEGASEFGEKPADWSSVLTTLDGLNNEVRTYKSKDNNKMLTPTNC